MSRIVIFGTGGLAHYISGFKREDTEIVAYLNTISELESIDGIPVVNIEGLASLSFDYVVIAFSQYEKGFALLKGIVPSDKITVYSFVNGEPYKNRKIYDEINELIDKELNASRINELFDIPLKRIFPCAMNRIESPIVEADFVREQTLAMLAEEIKRKHVEGDVAEVGVFKGDFSKKINALFADRKLYLFDTFEGFHSDEVKTDNTLSWGEITDKFNGVNIEEVLNKMPNKSNCIIKKGFFPDTFDLFDKVFSFVSIDVDLYAPIKNALEIFWPRLAWGGI